MLKHSQHIILPEGGNLKIPTLINAFSKITGDLVITTDLRIDGKIFGKVESDKNIFIGKDGFVKGFIRANNLVTYGRIEGNIIVSGITILHPGSSVFGSLYTKVINVIEGAVITAHVRSYDKLEPIDEAQISLAEKINMPHLSQITVPLYADLESIIDEKVVKTGQKTVDLEKKAGETPTNKENQASHAAKIKKLSHQREHIYEHHLPDLDMNPTFNNPQSSAEELSSDNIVKSALFESLMNHPVGDYNNFLNSEIEKLNKEAAMLQPQIDNKSNNHNVFKFKEVEKLLHRIKFSGGDSEGKENDQIKPNSL